MALTRNSKEEPRYMLHSPFNSSSFHSAEFLLLKPQRSKVEEMETVLPGAGSTPPNNEPALNGRTRPEMSGGATYRRCCGHWRSELLGMVECDYYLPHAFTN